MFGRVSGGEFHPSLLSEPCLTVSHHTALRTYSLLIISYLFFRLIPFPVGLLIWSSTSPPSLHPHYRGFNTTTRRSATEKGIATFCLAFLRFRHFHLTSLPCFSRSLKEPASSSCHLYAVHQTDSKQVILSLLSQRSVSNSGFDAPYFLLTTPHQWFTHVHLLDAHLDRFTPAFQLSFTTNQFPFRPHKVVCKLRLHAVCGGPTTISFKVPKQSHQEAISTRFLLVTHSPDANI